MSCRRPIKWLGSSFRDFGRLPINARDEFNIQLREAQRGFQPLDWKPMKSVGVGVKEVRIRIRNDIFRLIYLAKYSDFVYVLHVFQKKSRQTNSRDIDIARRRFKSIAAERTQVT
jgi:phage-related protein